MELNTGQAKVRHSGRHLELSNQQEKIKQKADILCISDDCCKELGWEHCAGTKGGTNPALEILRKAPEEGLTQSKG